jgi:hypothetical protein
MRVVKHRALRAVLNASRHHRPESRHENGRVDQRDGVLNASRHHRPDALSAG